MQDRRCRGGGIFSGQTEFKRERERES